MKRTRFAVAGSLAGAAILLAACSGNASPPAAEPLTNASTAPPAQATRDARASSAGASATSSTYAPANEGNSVSPQPLASTAGGTTAISRATVLASGTNSPGASAGSSAQSDNLAARASVNDFLTLLQQDPSGGKSKAMLAPDELAKIQNGSSVISLLGVQNVYQSFSLGNATPAAANQLKVEATLQYGASSLRRDFTVSQQQSGWLITSIAPAPGSA